MIQMDNAFFDRLMENMSEFFGDMCEIVVHDYRLGPDATIVKIINGEMSGRKVGDAPRSGLILGAGKNLDEFHTPSVFYFTNPKGRICKSCTTLITDENNKIIGSVCINLDVTHIFQASGTLKKLLDIPSKGEKSESDNDRDILVNNVDDVLSYFLNIAIDKIGKDPRAMSKNEKIQALGFLDRKGILKISKVSLELCERFDISKFTLYSYLDEARMLYKGKEIFE